MKFNWLFGSVLISCMLFLTFGQCHAQQYSPEFQALLNQVQQAYLTPKGNNLSSLRNKYPTVLSTLIGHALRQQAVHVQQNPSLNNRFMDLQQEAQSYIGEVARTTPARFLDGSRWTLDGLWYIVNKSLEGENDDWIVQNYGVRIGTMPSVLAASPGPQPLPAISAKPSLQINRIDLKPPVVAAGRTFDLLVDFSVADQSAADEKIPVRFSYQILEGDKVLYESKPEVIQGLNGKATTRTEPIRAAKKRGTYKINVAIQYKNAGAERSIDLRIE